MKNLEHNHWGLPVAALLIGLLSLRCTGSNTTESQNARQANKATDRSSLALTINETTTIKPGDFEVHWRASESEDFSGFKLVVAEDSACASEVFSFRGITETSFVLNISKPGQYYICIFGLNATGDLVPAINNGASLLIAGEAEEDEGEGETVEEDNSVPNTAPTIAIVTPVDDDDVASGTMNVTISWTDSDPDNDAAVSLYYKTTSTGACETGTLITSSLTEDDATDSYSWSVTSVPADTYYVCAKIDDGVNPAVTSHSGSIVVSQPCMWNGSTDTDWGTAANWQHCSGGIPGATDEVLIPAAASNQPTVSASTDILGFFLDSGGGGVITIASGVTLGVTTGLIKSSVTLKGDTSTCTTCVVTNVNGGLTISDDATLTVSTGLIVSLKSFAYVYVGTGTTAGHLATDATGTTSNEWPTITGVSTSGWYGLRVEGTPANKSTLSVDGLKIRRTNGSTSSDIIIFINHYDIVQFDNFSIGRIDDPKFVDRTYLSVSNCANGTFSDLTWSGIEFVHALGSGKKNIDIDDCTGIGPIAVSGSGYGFGESFESDANGVLTWTNGSSFNCEWNGSQSTAWNDPLNWNSCANGRNNYPDQLDRILVPTGTTYDLTFDTKTYFQGFASGTGGGTVYVDAATEIFLMDSVNTIRSDVILSGTSNTCSDCEISAIGDARVTDGANLSLAKGIKFNLGQYGKSLFLGDGATSGHLSTLASGAPEAEWPVIGSISTHGWAGVIGAITLGGVSGDLSSVNIDGLSIERVRWDRNAFIFSDYFDIAGFDNITMDNIRSDDTVIKDYILFTDCSNSTITDTTWDALNFVDGFDSGGTYYNINMTGCSGAGPVTITGSGTAYGAGLENDPDNVLTW